MNFPKKALEHQVDMLTLAYTSMYPSCRERDEAEAKKLSVKQQRFTFMLGLLIVKAYSLGYTLTLSEGYTQAEQDKDHMKGSLHYVKLAQDLNLFHDGVYLTSSSGYEELGKYWESLGGSWGGRFNDGNHFSLAHDGKK